MAKSDLRPDLSEIQLSAAPVRPDKLSVTVSTKLGEAMAFRFFQRAQRAGMAEAQFYRIYLERLDALLEIHDDPRLTPVYFASQLTVNTKQLNLFPPDGDRRLRSRR